MCQAMNKHSSWVLIATVVISSVIYALGGGFLEIIGFAAFGIFWALIYAVAYSR